MNEDDPQRVISLRGKGHGTIVHQAGPCSATTGYPFIGTTQLHYQSVYTPAQVGAEGVIKRISINRSSMTVGNYSNFKIFLAHTSLTNLTNTFANNFNGYQIEVFSEANVVANSSNGDTWIHFDLNGNFTYDSSHNLLVDIQWNGRGGTNVQSHVTADVGVKRIWSTTGAATGTTNSWRPAYIFATDVVDNGVVDEGTGSSTWPFCSGGNPEMRQQMLFNYSLINGSGVIDKICFQAEENLPADLPEWAVMENLSIRMAHSQNDTLGPVFEANHIGSWTEVFNRSSYNLSTVGRTEWIEIDIDNLFNYNGNDNLLIEVRWLGGYGSDTGVNLCMNYSSTYDGQMGIIDYSATTGAPAANRLYNLQTIFTESANLTWSASSSDPGLFSASVSGGYNLQITPQPDAFGSGTVYLVLANSDGRSVSRQVPVTINPVNDAPVLDGVPSPIYCTEDVDYALDMTPYASDIDDDFANLTFNTDSPYAFPDNHTIIFNYPEGFTNDSVTIRVEDPDGLTDTVVVDVEITPVNDEPELLSYTASIICHATVSRPFLMDPDDEETPDNITIFVDSPYATVNGITATFLYPKGIGTDTVTIYVVDELIYGSLNNVSYILNVTIIDHPEVVSHTPSGTGVTVTTTVTVTFDMAMDKNATEASFGLSTPTRADINGTFVWNAANTMMTFTPESYLADGSHQVTIGTGATNESGIAMLEAYSWNFTASGNADADGDNMPDRYEINNGLNPIFDDSASDRDGDGATNYDEYLAETDPNDPNDKPPSDIPWLLIILVILIVFIVIVVAIMMLMKKGKRDPRDFDPDDPPMGRPPQEI
jgi:hypothetical protein